MTNDGKAYKDSCFGGAVQFTVSGEPHGMSYCHESGRRWSGACQRLHMCKPEAVQITLGAESIGTYNKMPHS